MKVTSLEVGLAVVIVVLVAYTAFTPQNVNFMVTQPESFGAQVELVSGLRATNSSSTVGYGTPVEVFSTSTSAVFRSVSNLGDSLTPVAYLYLNATSTGVKERTGIPVFSSTTVTFCDNGCSYPLWRGLMFSLAGAGTTTTLSTSEIK